jgi:DNA polymerase-3 subunit epsilon
VRELRLLAAHAPPYNKRSKFPQRWWWVVLTDEPFPRFSAVRAPKHDRTIGPFRARADAVETATLLAQFTGVRTCGARLGRSARHGPACAERELSPCPAPRDVAADGYAAGPLRAHRLIAGDDGAALSEALAHIEHLAAHGRYESAARLRDHTATAIDALWRGQRLRALSAVAELVAARPDDSGGWHLAVIRRGQLGAAGNARRGVPPMPVIDAICAAAQVILPAAAPLGGALVEESALIARWLSHPGVRIVRTDNDAGGQERSDSGNDSEFGYATPLAAAGRLAEWAAQARSARIAAEQAVGDDYDVLHGPRRASLRPALRPSG